MNILASIPFDCIVISQPSSHTLQSTPIYIIPNPIQALAIHSGCHLGRFPLLPYAFDVITFILRRYYAIYTTPRFPPFKAQRMVPSSNITINATNWDLVTLSHDPPHASLDTMTPQGALTSPITAPFTASLLSNNNNNNNNDSHPTHTPLFYNFYTIFLLTSPEVSLLLKANIIRLIDGVGGGPIPNHQTLLPQVSPDMDGYPLDFAQLTSASGWRLMPTIRYACTDTIYRFKPYNGYDMFQAFSTNQQVVNTSLSVTQPSSSSSSPCPIHHLNKRTEQFNINLKRSPPSPLNNNPDPLLICNCPTVLLSSQQQSSNITKFPIHHPPHDHSTYTLLYPQNLSHSHASRQSIQLFTGYNSPFISRIIQSKVIPNPNTSKPQDQHAIIPIEISQSQTIQHSLHQSIPHIFLDEIKTLSLMGHYESIISLSSRVSKESYKQLVVIKPTSIGPIDSYVIESNCTTEEQSISSTGQIPLIAPHHHGDSNIHVDLASITSRHHDTKSDHRSLTPNDLISIFGDATFTSPTPNPTIPRQKSARSHQFNRSSTHKTALFGNTVKFQHYSNRIPVHTGSKD